MTEPGVTEERRGRDYDASYVARFGMLKLMTERRGLKLKYEYPNEAGIGWKIHLAVSHDPTDPLTRKIADFIDKRRFVYKIGHGGYQEEGKGMTIYVGDRDTTEDLANDLTDTFGDEIPEPKGDVLGDDMQVVGKVWARFENQGDAIRNTGTDKYRQYGSQGVPALKKDDDLWENPEDKLTNDEKRQHSVAALTEDYGAFFTGTRNHPV